MVFLVRMVGRVGMLPPRQILVFYYQIFIQNHLRTYLGQKNDQNNLCFGARIEIRK